MPIRIFIFSSSWHKQIHVSQKKKYLQNQETEDNISVTLVRHHHQKSHDVKKNNNKKTMKISVENSNAYLNSTFLNYVRNINA